MERSGHTSDVFSLNLKNLTFKNHTDSIKGQSPARKDKLCCWSYKNKLILFGGFGEAPEFSSNSSDFVFEVFNSLCWNNELAVLDCTDHENLKWEWPGKQGDFPCPRAAHACTQIGGMGYMFGGRFKDDRRNDLYSLDLETYKWKLLHPAIVEAGDGQWTHTSVPCGRSWHVLAAASDHHLFLYGGFDTMGQALNDTWIYDLKSAIWSRLENAALHLGLASTRMWHTACPTDTPGHIVIFGGCENSLLTAAPIIHSNMISVFHFSPLSLQRLCLDAVMCNYGLCKGYLHFLPRSLQIKISHRSHALGFNNDGEHGKLINSCAVM